MRIGDVIDGRYRIVRQLGEGGMGVVFAARHLQLDQPVAVKVLRREALEHEGIAQRFMREAQAAVRLRSEHVCRVFDVGTLPSGEPFMTMELLEGADLDAILKRDGALPIADAIDRMLHACDAIAEAHSLGIIHRDIKPANLFVTERRGQPFVKVLDFGIAKVANVVDGGLTSTQAVMGSPSYMSPEQLRATKSVDARSDIWALGVTLYELVAARRPFDGDTMSGLSIAIATEPYTPLSDAPPALAAVIDRCLQKRPEDRYRDVGELAAALAPLARTEGTLAPRIARVARAQLAETQPPDERPGIEAPRKRRWIVPAIGLAVVAAGATVFAVTRHAPALPAKPVAAPIVVDAAPRVDAAPIAPLVPDFHGGKRLAVQAFATAEGLARGRAIYDRTLDTPCVAGVTDDGRTRCIPAEFHGAAFSDAKCTKPIVARAKSCAAPKFVIGPSNTVFRAGPPKRIPTFHFDPTTQQCVEGALADDELAYGPGAKVAATEFVEMYDSVDARSTDLSTRTRGGGGMTMTVALYDQRNKVTCERDPDGVCRPFPITPGLFADAACTQPIAFHAKSTEEHLVAIYDPKVSDCDLAKQRKIVSELQADGTVHEAYAPVNGVCTKRSVTGNFDRIRDVVDDARLPKVALFEEPTSARITRRWFTDDANNHIMISDFYDRALAAPCVPARASDGVVRCMPVVGNGQIAYADTACTQPLLRVVPSRGCAPEAPTPVQIELAGGAFCPNVLSQVRAYRVGAKHKTPDRDCFKSADKCFCNNTSGDYYDVTELAPSAFATLTERVE